MASVICAGVAVIDLLMYVDDMPRQAEKYRARDAAIVGGGCAANAAAAIARLGGTAMLAARLGNDQIGDLIVSGLQHDGVDCALVRRFAGRQSSFSSIFVDASGERQIVNFRDTGMDTDGSWLSQIHLPAFDAALGDTRWPQGAAAILQVARERGKPGILDAEAPFNHTADAMSSASHIAFSTQGLDDFAGTHDVEAGLRKAAGDTGAWVCVTQGANGVAWLENGGLRHLDAFQVDAVDTLGAGDVWHGVFALALGEGASEAEAIRLANGAAAIKCRRPGGRAGAPSRRELESFLRERT